MAVESVLIEGHRQVEAAAKYNVTPKIARKRIRALANQVDFLNFFRFSIEEVSAFDCFVKIICSFVKL